MTIVDGELRRLVESGPMAHLTTVNADGSPQVSVIWIGMDGDDVVSGHLGYYAKLRNIERDPRVVLSFDAPSVPGAFMQDYAVLHGHAVIESREDTWDLLDRLAKVYVGPGEAFPAPRAAGWTLRYRIDRVTGVGPWAPGG
ncbi:PPOX class probable F420-dependent enzyme [Jatrophihabitans endophyticus]|uniref:PPOX class probable F420-dependent enzyme n=1 Tax=Jatrophihabitans endophyticus TaxID=1206085 RepID=A0A1M5EHG9_9ACTN|nr:PPOX class F420-dependent oxidoreductase [Jatrophihabitans endophyticus]SHF78606.1 PPOX class probable F420-dependent enzyme [Jatrophihabitans endophyticus]